MKVPTALWQVAWPEDMTASFPLPGRPLTVFFRADDIYRADASLVRLCRLFLHHHLPLNLAVIPAQMTRQHWSNLAVIERANPLWCWHQHGFAHRNHATVGKKSEFGPNRLASAVRRDLLQGRSHLQTILGEAFFPVFTPPWNRCDQLTLDLLPELGFLAISRFKEARPPVSSDLPDLQCNVDLHTLKAPDADAQRQLLLLQWQRAAATGTLGIMLHHEQMNDCAFRFLDQLLGHLRAQADLQVLNFAQLLARPSPP